MADVPAPVALGLAPIQPPANPLVTLGGYADLQNKMNSNRQFQQAFNAKQVAGQVLAAAPDLETGLADLYKNPQTAAFAPEIANSVREGQLAFANIAKAQAETQGDYQTQAQSGLQAVLKAVSGSLTDPSQFGAAVKAQLATMSPTARARVEPAIGQITTSLLDGLPQDPEQARAAFNKRLAGIGLAAGISPETINGLTFTPGIISQGSQIQPGAFAPGYAGGGFTPAGPALGIGAAPSWQTINGVPTPAQAIGPGGGGGTGPVGNALAPGNPSPVPGPSPVTTNALGGQGPAAVAGQASAGVGSSTAGNAASATAGALAGDGTPLIPPGTRMVSPGAGKGLAGITILSPTQQHTADALSSEFNSKGLDQFQSAQGLQASLKYMDNGLDALARGGGFLVPGTAQQFRNDFAKAANTIYSMAGQPVPFDPSKIASAEDMNKETTKMGAAVLGQFFGQQREAAETIMNFSKAVPGTENTYLGGKLVLGGIAASTQRVIDQRNFENEWQAKNQGNLTGAVEAFNRLHPAEQYAKGVLDSMGMTETGFKTPEAVRDAYAKGYMTADQAKAAIHSQFPSWAQTVGGGQ